MDTKENSTLKNRLNTGHGKTPTNTRSTEVKNKETAIKDINQVKDELPAELLATLKYWLNVEYGTYQLEDPDVDIHIARTISHSLTERLTEALVEVIPVAYYESEEGDSPAPFNTLKSIIDDLDAVAYHGEPWDGQALDTVVRRFRNEVGVIEKFVTDNFAHTALRGAFLNTLDRVVKTVKHGKAGEKMDKARVRLIADARAALLDAESAWRGDVGV